MLVVEIYENQFAAWLTYLLSWKNFPSYDNEHEVGPEICPSATGAPVANGSRNDQLKPVGASDLHRSRAGPTGRCWSDCATLPRPLK